MIDTLKIEEQQKRKVVVSILNLYLFDNIDTPKFKSIDGKLKTTVTSNFALSFNPQNYSDRQNPMLFEFFLQISQSLPYDLKQDIYYMMSVNSFYIFNKSIKMMENSYNGITDDFWVKSLKIESEVFHHFVSNPGLIDLMNDYLYFLSNFTSDLILDEKNQITKSLYYAIIRDKVKEINSREVPELASPSFKNHQ